MKYPITNRKIDNNGLVVCDEKSLIDSMFVDPKYIDKIVASHISKDIDTYNKWAKIYDFNQITTNESIIDHKENQKSWFMPEEYKNFDIESHLLSLCKNDNEIQRVKLELKEYNDRNLYNLLKYLKYLVDVMLQEKIIYGIGRGSSVSSFVLYLLKVHRINSLTMNLDISEFLK